MLLSGERLDVRPAVFEDLAATRELRFTPEMQKYGDPDHPVKTVEEEREWWEREVVSGRHVLLAICLRDGAVIGFLHCFSFNQERTVCETGISVFPPELHGRGYGTEAYRLVLPYLKGTLELHSMFVEVALDNFKALRLYEKLGYTRKEHISYGTEEFFRMTFPLDYAV